MSKPSLKIVALALTFFACTGEQVSADFIGCREFPSECICSSGARAYAEWGRECRNNRINPFSCYCED